MCYYTTHIASLLIAPSHTRTKYKMATTFGLTCEDSLISLLKLEASKTWKELTIGVQQLVRLLFKNNFIKPGLVLERNQAFRM